MVYPFNHDTLVGAHRHPRVVAEPGSNKESALWQRLGIHTRYHGGHPTYSSICLALPSFGEGLVNSEVTGRFHIDRNIENFLDRNFLRERRQSTLGVTKAWNG